MTFGRIYFGERSIQIPHLLGLYDFVSTFDILSWQGYNGCVFKMIGYWRRA